MNELTKRGEAFERRFAHEEAMRFKTIARRNKLMGLWAAQQLGKSRMAAEAYANTVVIADFDKPGGVGVIRKVLTDFEAAGVSSDADEVRRVLEEFMVRAIDEIRAGL